MRWMGIKSCIRPTLCRPSTSVFAFFVRVANIKPHGEQLHAPEGPISLALLALSGSLSRFLALSPLLSLAATLSAHPPLISLACALFLLLLTLSMFMLSLSGEQQTISTAGCFGIDLTCGCCQQPSNLARVDHSNLQKIDADSCFRRQKGLSAVTGAHGNETGMKLKKQISVNPVVTEEEEGATLEEINETGNAMQVLS